MKHSGNSEDKTLMLALTEKSMFFLSWLTALRSGTDSVCLITLTDSPEGKNRKINSKLPMELGQKNTSGQI